MPVLAARRVMKRSVALHIDQGIAVTSHASQGKTVDEVIVSVPVEASSQTNEAQFYVQFYVSMSRTRRGNSLDAKASAGRSGRSRYSGSGRATSNVLAFRSFHCSGVPICRGEDGVP